MPVLRARLSESIIRGYASSPIRGNRVVPRLYYLLFYSFPFFPNGSGWKITESDSGLVKLSRADENLLMQRHYASVMLMEERNWAAWYLPRGFSLRGKTVLDVGAGNGETASFFFRNGASRVVCIERDRDAARLLSHNARRNGWNVQVMHASFEPKFLALQHDFLKMDCEGGEEGLLDSSVTSLKPCRIEVHLEPRKYKALVQKFGLRSINGKDVWGKD
jgi:SAM-dependent methyltransferase